MWAILRREVVKGAQDRIVIIVFQSAFAEKN
jgi:hypothetical protein